MLTCKEKWTILIVISMLRQDEGKPVAKRFIAEDLGISQDYIDQLMAPLRKAGLVRTTRGIKGGFNVVNKEITAADVVLAIPRKERIRISSDIEDCDGVLRRHKINHLSYWKLKMPYSHTRILQGRN